MLKCISSKDTKHAYSSQCLAAALLCLVQIFTVVSRDGGSHLVVGLAAVTAPRSLFGRHCLLGLASLFLVPSLLLAVRSGKAPYF